MSDAVSIKPGESIRTRPARSNSELWCWNVLQSCTSPETRSWMN